MLGTDIYASPHIHSKIITWTKLHGCLQITLGVTGCGFNLTTNVLDVSDSTWATVVKVFISIYSFHHGGHQVNDLYFLYSERSIMFEKNRANDAATEDVMEAFNQIITEENDPITVISPKPRNVILEEDEMDIESQITAGETLKTASHTSGKKKGHT
ncbi:hypothetical protein ACS0TY_013723 [Phlomoides rotata]